MCQNGGPRGPNMTKNMEKLHAKNDAEKDTEPKRLTQSTLVHPGVRFWRCRGRGASQPVLDSATFGLMPPNSTRSSPQRGAAEFGPKWSQGRGRVDCVRVRGRFWRDRKKCVFLIGKKTTQNPEKSAQNVPRADFVAVSGRPRVHFWPGGPRGRLAHVHV